MGRLWKLELKNFKSYQDLVVGPFDQFTAIIGPNGSGKSNLMDAISFVLGIQSLYLRSNNMKELIYNGTINNEKATTASVSAYYETDNDDKEIIVFTRSILENGASEYRIDNIVKTFQEYIERLEKINILTKARNFLVFQGDVEELASKSSRELTEFVEQVSGSYEYKKDYDILKDKLDRAMDHSAFLFKKRRNLAMEFRSMKTTISEIEKHEKLINQKDELLKDKILADFYKKDERIKEQKRLLDANDGTIIEFTRQKQELEKELGDIKKSHGCLTIECLKLKRVLKQDRDRLVELNNNSEIISGQIVKKEDQLYTIKVNIECVERSIGEKRNKLSH